MAKEKSTPEEPKSKIVSDFEQFFIELREKAAAAVALGTFNKMLDRIIEATIESPNTDWTARSTLHARWGEIEAHLRLGHAGGVETVLAQVLATVRNASQGTALYVPFRVPPPGHDLLGR